MKSAEKPKPPGRLIWRVLRSVVLIYFLVAVIVFLFQRKLQYIPDRSSPAIPSGKPDFQEVTLTTSDNCRIKCWYWPARDKESTTVVYFHGNAGHRGHRMDQMEEFSRRGFGVFIFDYRGYGGSEGSPSESGLYLDAEAVLAWVEKNTNDSCIYFGESLGCGVAVEMATRKKPIALILQSGYSSLADVGQKAYPFLPVGLLMRDKYECMDKVKNISCPLLMVHGEKDNIIPPALGKKLFEVASEPKKWVLIRGFGHNNLGPWNYIKNLEEFLNANHVISK